MDSLTIPPQSVEDQIAYNLELERGWRKSQPRYTSKQWLEFFPEAIEVIPEKIDEWQTERGKVVVEIKKRLGIINEKVGEEHRWFWEMWVAADQGQQLVEIDKHLARLKHLHKTTRSREHKTDWLESEVIQQARSVAIEVVVGQLFELRRAGRNFVGLCPFHDEKTPSFTVYPEQNTYHCFGCGEHGDAISLVMKLNNCNFKEAVKSLTGGTYA